MPFKISEHSALLRHHTKKLLATTHQITAFNMFTRCSKATVSEDYLSLGLSLFIVTLDDKINLKLKEYSRHEL